MSEFDDQQEKPSKSQLKREMTALQKIGETLISLPEAQLAKIPLPNELLEAVQFAHTLKTHEAKRRHLQYIGKLMREIDSEPIQAALKKIQWHNEKNTVQFHEVEKWRDELIASGDEALQKFLSIHSDIDRQHLRQLIRNAQHDRKQNKDTGADTLLFRYLRDILNK